MARPFLTAHWVNLAIVTYPVPPRLLGPYLPSGLSLDTRNGDAFVSLVAFDFFDTRVWGIAWPGYRCFPELNLRFYVRNGHERGVVFIREYVSQRLIAWMANALYHEHYRVAPIQYLAREEPDRFGVEFRMHWHGRENTLSVVGKKPAIWCPETSNEHFFKEHRWGYGVDRRGRAVRYEVDHPVWECYPVDSWRVNVDWDSVYGTEWRFLENQPPCSVVLAKGSAVSVYPKTGLCRPASPSVELYNSEGEKSCLAK